MMLDPVKDIFTVAGLRALITKIVGGLSSKVAKADVVSSWQSTPDDAHVPTEKLVKDTIGNLPPGTAVKGDAENEYRTGNVNLTPDDIGTYSKTESDRRYKVVQTAVSDPTSSGVGLDFVDSVSQDANGVITPHKKTVQDGTTTQKGVVQLNNAINSSSTTEAATPKAVKDAYDELSARMSARAVFMTPEEWAEQSLLPGDSSKTYYVENGTGEDAYTVYVWKDSAQEYVEVDESSISLNGYWHDGPTTTGTGNVVTDISLGNDGVPQVVKGITALTQHQDISGKLDKTGDASNTTSTFTKASGDTSSIASGSKLSAIFTAISSFFASLKALAFKDTASYSDLSSGIQSSLNKADTALQSSNVTSSVTSGDTTHVPTADAVYNFLPRGVSSQNIGTNGSINTYKKLAKFKLAQGTGLDYAGAIFSVTVSDPADSGIRTAQALIFVSPKSGASDNIRGRVIGFNSRSSALLYSPELFIGLSNDGYYELWAYLRTDWMDVCCTLLGGKVSEFIYPTDAPVSSTGYTVTALTRYSCLQAPYNTAVGSTTQPVYVDSNGQVQPCTWAHVVGSVGSKANTLYYS